MGVGDKGGGNKGVVQAIQVYAALSSEEQRNLLVVKLNRKFQVHLLGWLFS